MRNEVIHSARQYLYHPNYRFEIPRDARTSQHQHSSELPSVRPRTLIPYPRVQLSHSTNPPRHRMVIAKVGEGYNTRWLSLASSCRKYLSIDQIVSVDYWARRTLHRGWRRPSSARLRGRSPGMGRVAQASRTPKATFLPVHRSGWVLSKIARSGMVGCAKTDLAVTVACLVP